MWHGKESSCYVNRNDRNPGRNLLTLGTVPGCGASNSGGSTCCHLRKAELMQPEPHCGISRKTAHLGKGRWVQGWTLSLQTGKTKQNGPCHQVRAKPPQPGFRERGRPHLDDKMHREEHVARDRCSNDGGVGEQTALREPSFDPSFPLLKLYNLIHVSKPPLGSEPFHGSHCI